MAESTPVTQRLTEVLRPGQRVQLQLSTRSYGTGIHFTYQAHDSAGLLVFNETIRVYLFAAWVNVAYLAVAEDELVVSAKAEGVTDK